MFDSAEKLEACSAARDAAIERFTEIRRESEALTANLTPEDQSIQSMPDVSPTKWHLAHTTWFFETFILTRLDPGVALAFAQVSPPDAAFGNGNGTLAQDRERARKLGRELEVYPVSGDAGEEVVRLTNELDADLIAITGDIVDRVRCLEWLPDTLGRLRARRGIFFVLGNHDVRHGQVAEIEKSAQHVAVLFLEAALLVQEIDGAAQALMAGQ